RPVEAAAGSFHPSYASCRYALCIRVRYLRPGRVRRLLRRLAGDPGFAFAADERHQCDLERHHRRRADRRRSVRVGVREADGLCRGDIGRRQHLRRIYRYAAHAADVSAQEIAAPRPIMSESLSALLYLVAAICFIMALRGLSSPETARGGNIFGI